MRLHKPLRLWVMTLTLMTCSFSLPQFGFAEVTINEMVPDFTLNDQNGEPHQLSSYRGKTVVLEWTNPTCPFVEYHYKKDTMTTLAAGYPEVIWLTIDSSHYATQAKSLEWAKAEKVKTVLIDSTGNVGRLFGARTTPHMYIINPRGELVYQGAIDDNPHMDERESLNYVSEALKALKEGKKISTAKTAPYGCSVKYAKK